MQTKTLILALSALCGSSVLAQTTAPTTMNQDAHFERLTYIRHMRVFEAVVPPGDATADHLHDHDVALATLQGSTTRSRRGAGDWMPPETWVAGAVQTTSDTGSPQTHRVENVGATPLRFFAVENLRDGGWTSLAPLKAPGTTLRQESRGFAIYDVRLDAGTTRVTHVHENPSFVVLMSGAVQVQGGGGESEFRLEAPGRWVPSSGADQPHTLMYVDGIDAHIICVEAR